MRRIIVILLLVSASVYSADFGDIPANLTIGAGQSVRRNAGNTLFEAYTPGLGAGTVTSFSAGDLSPLFTTSVANSTTTPALSFTLSNAAAHTFFANNTGSTGTPSFTSFVAGTDYWDTTVFTGSSSIGLVPQATGVPTCLRFLDENGSWTCASGGSSGGAPDDAHYLTSQAESGLTNEVNLGALTTGLLKITVAGSVATPSSITDNSSNWDTAFSERRQWDGGSTNLVAATGRTSLGGTTVGQNFFTLTNPSAITFPKIAADNSVTAESASTHRTSIGATTVGGNFFTLTNPSAITWARINADNTVTARTASETRTDLSLVVGTNVQAWDTQLDSLAGLSYTSNALKVVRVNAGENAFELATVSAGSVATDTIWDAKGDLAGGTGADTAARLAVGSNNTILMADSSQSTGLKWSTPTYPSTAGTTGNVLTSDGTNWLSSPPAGFGSMTGHGDSNYTILSTDRIVFTNANFTASRTWTLPAANSVAAGTALSVIDLQGTLTTSNTILLTRAGSDTIEPAALTTIAMENAKCGIQLISNGSNKWYITYHSLGTTVNAGTIPTWNNSAGVWELSTLTLPVTSTTSSGKIFIASGSSSIVMSTPTYPNSATTNGVVVGDGTNFAAEAPSATTVAKNLGGWKEYYVTGSDVTRTAQTLADITGLVTGTLSISSVYEFEAFLPVASTSAAGNQYAVTCSVAPTRIMAIQNGATSTTAAAVASINASGTAMTATMTYNGDGLVTIKGNLTTAGSGSPVLSIQHLKVTSGTSTVYIGATLRIRKK